MLNVTMFYHLNTNRWDLHINQPQGESCIKHVCCISRMNFYRSNFKHKIYGLYTGKYGTFNIDYSEIKENALPVQDQRGRRPTPVCRPSK